MVREHLEPALQTFPNLAGIHRRAPNYFIDLTAQAGFDGYLTNTVDSKTNRDCRRRLRQLEQLGQVEYVTYRTPDELLRFDVKMRSIEKVSWKGREQLGHLSKAGSAEFF